MNINTAPIELSSQKRIYIPTFWSTRDAIDDSLFDGLCREIFGAISAQTTPIRTGISGQINED
jgi:hypothetical protein